MHGKVLFLALFLCIGQLGSAQLKTDSLQLTLPQAEQAFVQKNLLLLAQRYNIDAARAYVIQAKLYPNPNINFAQSAYNTQTKKWFELGAAGERAAQLQQLVLLAGKINKQVKIAETNVKLAELSFYDLLRTLKFTLRNDFFTIYYLQQTAKIYKDEIDALEKISAAFEQQRDKGYLARTEVVRIKAQLYSFRSEYNDLVNQINDKQSEFRLVMQVAPTNYFVPVVDSVSLSKDPQAFALATLVDSAYQNRTDLQIAKANITLSQQNYVYQKALAVPDLTFGFNYDKAGSYVPDANVVSLGFNIPLFNRNQGNIKAYKSLISFNEMQAQSTQRTVEEQVYRSLQRAIDANRLYQGMDKNFTQEFASLNRAVLENYQKRNIGLLDFLNFYDSYKQYIVQLNYILLNRVSAMENINYLTGTTFYNK